MKNFTHAIVCELGDSFKDALTSQCADINLELAREQHEKYIQALVDAGIKVISAPKQEENPDSVYVEDALLIFDEIVILTNPGALSRRNEPQALKSFLPQDRPCIKIEGDCFLDGGDVLVVNKNVYIGESSRTNVAAIDFVRQSLKPYGYEVTLVKVPGLDLHLKSGVTAIGDLFILCESFNFMMQQLKQAGLNPEYYLVNESEKVGANVLKINNTLLIPENCPKLKAFIHEKFPELIVRELNMSESNKKDGALTCTSVLFNVS